jgi:nicotinamidase-related amidase
MDINKKDTAVLITDAQNDFLSEQGVTWKLVGDSVKENKTVENIERLFKTAKANGFEVFVSPHYYYPTDHGWKFGGTIEKVMHDIKMFDRSGALSLEGFSGSGADWLESYKPYVEDGKTVVNDVALQLRKRGINKVILGGMSANLCVEAHLRELLEQGFEVIVVKDATAGARHPELGDGYQAALINYGYMANAVLTTDEAVKAMES